MAKSQKSAVELKELIAVEFRKSADGPGLEGEALIIVRNTKGWLATLRRDGPRIDEARLAAVSEISYRLRASYDWAEGAR